MTNFAKEQFHFDGMYLMYGADRKFVARFKYRKNTKAGFQSFLIKNFSVEEYFGLMETIKPNSTYQTWSPAEILESKGYMAAWQKKTCKQEGQPVTREGFKAAIKIISDRAMADLDARKKLQVVAVI